MSAREKAQDIVRETFGVLVSSWSGRFVLAVSLVAQATAWFTEDEPAWALLVRLAVVPIYLALTVGAVQILMGAGFALVHARRPTHSYVIVDLKDGRQRSAQVCMAPCCLRAKIKHALKHEGIVWSLPGSDDEEFPPEEVESWQVMPVDNPEPHSRASWGEVS